MTLIIVGQITSTSSMTHNLAQCRSVIRKAVAVNAKAVFFPEASDYIASSPTESLSLCQPASRSPFVLGLRHDAKTHSLSISVGVHEPADDISTSGRITNTLLWIDEQGEISQRYQKIHLFDVDIANGPVIKESNSTEPGTQIVPPFSTVVGKIGSMICFDLRFPEISLKLRHLGADILLYPSAFTVPTGQAHWLSLLRARAIECQCYVVAAAQVGQHNEKRTSYGHSVVIDPWGEVIAEASGESTNEAESIFAEIHLDRLAEVRQQMPLLRRTDVYAAV